MEKGKIVKLWSESAKRDKRMADDALDLKHYDWCLFFWQLAIEKLLKALILKKEKSLLPVHDLYRLE